MHVSATKKNKFPLPLQTESFDAGRSNPYDARHGDEIMPKLILLPEGPGSEPFDLIEQMTLIGRKADNTLQVEDPNVSKYHALLVKTEEGYRLFDLHSANGTFVNDHRITNAEVKHNDLIRVGPAIFRFQLETASSLAPSHPTAPKVRFRPSLKPEPAPAAPAAATTIAPTPPPAPAPAIPKPATAPLKKEEPRVAIRIPEAKKAILPTTPPHSVEDKKETRINEPVAPAPIAPPPPAPAPAAPAKPRLGLGMKPAAPAPATVTPPPPPAITTLGGPKPPSTERSLRPKLGGPGAGEMKLKTFKK